MPARRHVRRPRRRARAFLQHLALSTDGYTLRLLALGAPERLGPLEPQVAEMAAGIVIK